LGARPRPSGHHPRTAEIEARATEIAKAQTALFQARISEWPLVNQGLKDETVALKHAAAQSTGNESSGTTGRTNPND